jgi:hypothetical protein
VIAIRPGQVRFVARATVYGVTRADTVVYRVTWPAAQAIDIVPGSALPTAPAVFAPSDVRLVPWGVVVWHNTIGGDSVDVTFEDPTNVGMPPAIICSEWLEYPDDETLQDFGPGPHCGTGNVSVPGLPLPDPVVGGSRLLWTTQVRQFPVPGIYRYHSTRTGATGRIIVTNDPDPSALP